MSKACLLFLATVPFVASAADVEVVDVRDKGDVLIVEESREPRREARPPRDVPVRGMDMANVRNVYGAPRAEHAAVGEPPITRWDYDGYSVFFEHDKVIHTVITQ